MVKGLFAFPCRAGDARDAGDGPCFGMRNCEKVQKEAERRTGVSAPIVVFPRETGDGKAQEVGLRGKLELLKLLKLS